MAAAGADQVRAQGAAKHALGDVVCGAGRVRWRTSGQMWGMGWEWGSMVCSRLCSHPIVLQDAQLNYPKVSKPFSCRQNLQHNSISSFRQKFNKPAHQALRWPPSSPAQSKRTRAHPAAGTPPARPLQGMNETHERQG